MLEGSDVSPKGVAEIEVSLDSVVEKVRDRRDAVLEGKVTPSTIPNFPSTPVRRSLVSIDDEEIETYRIEITTDNVVKEPVPARFSASEKEEYLAEFDMVDPEGEVIPPSPPKISRMLKAKPTRTGSNEPKKGNFTPFAFGSGSKEQSGSLKSGSSKRSKKSVDTAGSSKSGGPLAGMRKRTNSTEGSKKITVRDLVQLETEHIHVEAAPPAASDDSAKDGSASAPAAAAAAAVGAAAGAVSAAAVAPEATKEETESLPKQSDEEEEAATPTQTEAEAATPTQTEAEAATPTAATPTQTKEEAAKNTPPQTDKKNVAIETAPPRTEKESEEAKPNHHTGGIFSSLRKRTNSGGKNKSFSKSSPARVAAKTPPPPAVQKPKPPIRPMPPQEEGVWPEPSIEWDGTPTSTPVRTKKYVKKESKAVQEQAIIKSTPVDLDESIVPSIVPSEPQEPNEASPDKDKSTKDDDTKSTKSSTTSSSDVGCQAPMSFPGEAAVEGLLEKFFDNVTCSCINDRCAGGEVGDRELPSYMVVEIQKIHQKAQAKKAEIAEKKQARRANKSIEKTEKKSTPLVKDKVAKALALSSPKRENKEKKKSSLFDMKPASPERKAPPSYEWGEKVLEQDSVTTASSAAPNPNPPGFTVGAFIQRKFGLFENTKAESGDERSIDVDESDADSVDVNGAILKISPVRDGEGTKSVHSPGAVQTRAPGEGSQPEERVIVLSQKDEEDGSESLLDAPDEGDSLLQDDDDEDSEYTTELIQVDFDPSKLGNTTDADMYLAREVLRRYAEITGISLDELIEDVVDESLASVTLDAYGFPADCEGSGL